MSKSNSTPVLLALIGSVPDFKIGIQLDLDVLIGSVKLEARGCESVDLDTGATSCG